jgi:5-methylcytosine-specific restriction endonuclease McrA
MQMPAVRECKLRARRAYRGPNKQMKWEYLCAHCKGWFPDKETQVDHVVPVGSLRSFEDVGSFAQRLLFPSNDELQVLCKADHQAKTNRERELRKESRKRAT